jgi:hypothetical protein
LVLFWKRTNLQPSTSFTATFRRATFFFFQKKKQKAQVVETGPISIRRSLAELTLLVLFWKRTNLQPSTSFTATFRRATFFFFQKKKQKAQVVETGPISIRWSLAELTLLVLFWKRTNLVNQ